MIATQKDLNALVALQVAASFSGLIHVQVNGKRGSAPVIKQVKLVAAAICKIRPLWPNLPEGTAALRGWR